MFDKEILTSINSTRKEDQKITIDEVTDLQRLTFYIENGISILYIPAEKEVIRLALFRLTSSSIGNHQFYQPHSNIFTPDFVVKVQSDKSAMLKLMVSLLADTPIPVNLGMVDTTIMVDVGELCTKFKATKYLNNSGQMTNFQPQMTHY